MVEIVHWNPRRRRRLDSVRRRAREAPLTNNFGDLLGPLIVERIRAREGLSQSGREARLLTVGSILHLAGQDDVIWGTGVNGKSLDEVLGFTNLDVRAVRGPRTRRYLLDKGIEAPSVYGDPALLIPHLWTEEELGLERNRWSVGVVPNFHDYRSARRRRDLIDPTRSVWEVVRAIAGRRFVVGSSLHGVIVAEALGVPARFVASTTEPQLKYRDYIEGTGRRDYEIAPTVQAALAMGPAAPPVWDPAPLLDAFPRDLWTGESSP